MGFSGVIRLWLTAGLLQGPSGSGLEQLAVPRLLTDPHSMKLGDRGALQASLLCRNESSPEEEAHRLLTEYSKRLPGLPGRKLTRTVHRTCLDGTGRSPGMGTALGTWGMGSTDTQHLRTMF